MKSNFVLTGIVSLIAFGSLAFTTPLIAQNGSYEIQWVETPRPATVSFNCINDNGLVGGHWIEDADDSEYAFIYDSNSAQFFELGALLTAPNPAQMASNKVKVLDLNNQGKGVAVINGSDIANRLGIWFDLASGEWDYVPTPRSVESLPDSDYYGRQINNFGDILVPFRNSDSEWEAYIYNPFDATRGATPQYLELGFPLASNILLFTDMRHVIGRLSASDTTIAFRWTTETTEFLDPQFSVLLDVNNQGEICGQAEVFEPVNRKKYRRTFDAFRFRGQADFDLLPPETKVARAINDAGDVYGTLEDGEFFLFYEGQVILVEDLLVGEDDDVQFFKDSSIYVFSRLLANRESDTDLGRIAGIAIQTIGKGNNQTIVKRPFVLVPR